MLPCKHGWSFSFPWPWIEPADSVARGMRKDQSIWLSTEPTSWTYPSYCGKLTDPQSSLLYAFRSTAFYGHYVLIIKTNAGGGRYFCLSLLQKLPNLNLTRLVAAIGTMNPSIAFQQDHLLPGESASLLPHQGLSSGIITQLCLRLNPGSPRPSPDLALPDTDWRRDSFWKLEVPNSFSFLKHGAVLLPCW